MKPSRISERDHVSGPLDGPLVLVEYGDFECPYCVKAYSVIESVREDFRASLCFVYRHFPKSGAGAGFTKQAAEASEFAASQGQFWPMYAHLFSHAGQHDLEHLVEAANVLGLDPEACRKALVDRTFAPRVREITVASIRSGIIGTPTLFINDVRYENQIESEPLSSALKKQLASIETLRRESPD